jgi:hypothetical protein
LDSIGFEDENEYDDEDDFKYYEEHKNKMPAHTPDELRACIADEPQVSPSTHLADESYAAWCYDNMTLKEARSAFERDADAEDCDRWGLTALEWKAQVEMAIIALVAVERMG